MLIGFTHPKYPLKIDVLTQSLREQASATHRSITMPDLNAAAEALLNIRRTRNRLSELPEALRPLTIEEAYAVQDLVVAKLGGVGAWKIVHPPAGAAPRCSPIPAPAVLRSGATIAWDSLLWPEVEVEIAVTLGQDLPPRTLPYETADIVAAISSVNPAFELLGSRFLDRTAVSRTESLADLLSSAGVVVGAGVADWQSIEFATVSMSLRFDDVPAGAANGGPSTAEVLETLTWLANHATGRTGGLRAGQIVITGARVQPVTLPDHNFLMHADVPRIGSLDLRVLGSAPSRS